MNVLHVIAGSLEGGAAKGARSLHEALLKIGFQSRILTNADNSKSLRQVETTKKGATGAVKTKLLSFADRAPKFIYLHRTQLPFSTGLAGFDLRKFDSFESANIIHLHWINSGFVSMRYLTKLGKPIVWTLRDMWPITGGCHYALKCERYKSQCGKCPQLRSERENDISRVIFNNKKKHFPPSMEIVATSDWIKQCASESALMKNHKISTVHNGIDTSRFFPIKKSAAKRQLHIPENSKVLLFGAQYIDDQYKGFEFFLKTIPKLSCTNIFILLFGKFIHYDPNQIACPYLCVGFVDTEDQMRLLYSAADVFVAPAMAEAFGKTTAEAQACGTPVVCFDAFGQKDIVDHMHSGYRAKTFDIDDLAYGIDWVVEDETRHKMLCEESRKRAVEKFDISVTSQKYLQVYESVLQRAAQKDSPPL